MQSTMSEALATEGQFPNATKLSPAQKAIGVFRRFSEPGKPGLETSGTAYELPIPKRSHHLHHTN